jgi:tetratricopeptide (TPR) repeat protein
VNPERWRQIEAIFQAALEREPADRAAFVAEAAGDDAELRRDVASLLAQPVADTFLEAPIRDAARAVTTEADDARVGQRVGAYRITGLVGHGGMGDVYRGVRDDDQYQKQVAIKLVRSGIATESLLRRFRHERQILASLEHPNIARLLDGGTTDDGVPYLVMEFIEGVPITTYCEQQSLTIPQRLSLFLHAASAVSYAHQNLVVHRDLKPSNVLVTAGGTPKLLDFGIAKLLSADPDSDDTPKTMTALHLMTPDYASPEQVRGLPISTATDVYSLGAVLYEMLCGERAHRFTSYTPADIERVVCNTEISKPSTAARHTGAPVSRLHRRLAGDLDTVVLMAMRKEPERRYGSIEQFAEDVRRYLDGRPILARQDTFGYRAGKYLWRHRIAVAAVALILISLTAGLATTIWQAQRAERRFQQVRRLANTVLFDLSDQIAALPGATQARELVAKTGLEYLDSLAAEAAGDPALQLEVAEGYFRLALVQGGFRVPGLEQMDAALASHRKAQALGRELMTRDPRNTKVLAMMVKTHSNIGDILQARGDLKTASAEMEEALRLSPLLESATDLTSEEILDVIVLLHFAGDLDLRMGNRRSAEQKYRQSLDWDRRLMTQYPGPRAEHSYSLDLATFGDALAAGGDLDGAMAQYHQALAIRLKNVKENPDNTRYRRELALLYSWMGHFTGNPMRISLGDLTKAEEYYRQNLAITEELAAADSKNVQARMDLSFSHEHLGDVIVARDPKQAAAHYRQAQEVLRPLLDASPKELRYVRRQLIQERQLAVALGRAGDRSAGLARLREVLTRVRVLAADHPANDQVSGDLYLALVSSAALLRDTGSRPDAARQLDEAHTIALTLSKQRPDDLVWRWRVADVYSAFGLQARRGDGEASWGQACDWRRKALAEWEAWPRHATSSAFDKTRRDRAARATAECQAP